MTLQNEERGTAAAKVEWDQPQNPRPREAYIRDTTLYLSAPLLEWMELVWGGPVNFVKSRTDEATGEVCLAPARQGEAGATPLRSTGIRGTAGIAFWRPLRKLSIKLPPDRLFHLAPRLEILEENLPVFVLSMNGRISVPADVIEKTLAGATTPSRR